MGRATVFVGTGLLWGAFVGWTLVSDYRVPPPPGGWFGVLFFSVVLVSLTFALPTLVAGTSSGWAFWGSRIAAIGALGAAISNVIEDGLRVDAAFFAFVGFLLLTEIGLAVMAGASIWMQRGNLRLFSAVPLSTLALITVLFPAGGIYRAIGGALVVGSWLLAAWLTASRRDRVSA